MDKHLGYSSKAKLEQFTRKLLNDIAPAKVVPNSYEFNFLCQLLDRHPNKDEKIGVGINYFLVTKWFAGVALELHRIDGSMVDVSWVTCCKGVGKSNKENLISAMRRAIRGQVLTYKALCESKCELCGTTKGSMHVDHVVMFKDLVGLFLAQMLSQGIEPPILFDDDPEFFCAKFRKEDFDFMLAWQVFHKNHASLRILCANCNLGRK